jgi:hypothetical protein
MAEDGWAEAAEEQQKVVEENAPSEEDSYDPSTQGFRDEDDVKQHSASVPGIFGDLPTDPTLGDSQTVTKNEEEATVNLAEADLAAASGDEEAQEASQGEVKRQTDAVGADETAEEVDEAADDDDSDDEDDDNS